MTKPDKNVRVLGRRTSNALALALALTLLLWMGVGVFRQHGGEHAPAKEHRSIDPARIERQIKDGNLSEHPARHYRKLEMK